MNDTTNELMLHRASTMKHDPFNCTKNECNDDAHEDAKAHSVVDIIIEEQEIRSGREIEEES